MARPFGAPPALVLDSGGGYVRAGLATGGRPAVVEPNCVAEQRGAGARPPAIGSAMYDLPSYAIQRPTQRGLIVDPDQQQSVWEAVLARLPGLEPGDCGVLATQAPFAPEGSQREVEEILFEGLGFREACVMAGPPLVLHSPGIRAQLDGDGPCCTVLDLGFSGCVAQPCLEGLALQEAGRRLSVGGRALTNLMLERLRLRHYDLGKSWLLADDILQKVGAVSLDFDADLRSGYAGVDPLTYVLPDFKRHCRGFVEAQPEAGRAPEASAGGARGAAAPGGGGAATVEPQCVRLRAERVAVPEMLFSPADHGVRQAGLAEVVRQAVMGVEREAWRPHFGRVVLCGGLARLPGLRVRLRRELRSLLPSEWPVSVVAEEEPELSVWRGASRLASDPEARRAGLFQSRRDYLEGARASSAGAAGGAKRKAPWS